MGLEPNQMRVFSRLSKPAVAGDEIDITLRLASLNLEIYMADEAGARDMVTDRGFGRLLDAKIDRFTAGAISRESFSQLVAVEDLPDIGSAIAADEISVHDTWEFRNTKNAEQFRRWFDEQGPMNPTELVREYVGALRGSGLWASGRAKLVRFIVLQSLGATLVPMTGGASLLVSMGLSAADSFLLERVRRGYNPRYFIDDMRHQMFSE